MTYTPDPCYTPIDVRGPGYDEGKPPFYWYITGGFMRVTGPWRMCYKDHTTGYTEMTGGELIFEGNILCPRGNDSTATVLLHGGTIEAGGMEFKTGGLFDIAGDGTLILEGDQTDDVHTWINDGYLTAYGGAGELVYDYDVTDPCNTTITALSAHFRAWKPRPGHLAEDVCPADVNLSWTPGDFAADVNGHDIYLGTSLDDVNASATAYRDGHDTNSWSIPFALEVGRKYYWRIDEVNDGNVWTGSVWEFTTENGKASDPFPTDDHRGYSPSQVPALTWTKSCVVDTQKVYLGEDLRGSIALFEDGFESGGFGANWTSSGWTVYDANTEPNHRHEGRYSAEAGSGGTYTLTSADVDTTVATTDACSINISVWLRMEEMTGGTVQLEYYNQSSGWDLIADWNSLDPCDTWLNHSKTVTDSKYRISNFKIRLTANITGGSAGVYVDDVVISNNWPAAAKDKQQLASRGQVVRRPGGWEQLFCEPQTADEIRLESGYGLRRQYH
jgi:hypothetical protein